MFSTSYFSDITTLLSSSFGSFQIPVSQLLRPIILLSLLEETTQLCKFVLQQNCVLQFDFWSLLLFKSHSDNCKTSFPTVSPLSLEAYFNSYFTEKIELIMDGLLKFPTPKNYLYLCPLSFPSFWSQKEVFLLLFKFNISTWLCCLSLNISSRTSLYQLFSLFFVSLIYLIPFHQHRNKYKLLSC